MTKLVHRSLWYLLLSAAAIATSSCGSVAPTTSPRAEVSTTAEADAPVPDAVAQALAGEVLVAPKIVYRTPASFGDVLTLLGQTVPPPFKDIKTAIYFATGSFESRPGPGAGSVPGADGGPIATIVIVADASSGAIVYGTASPTDITGKLPVDGTFSCRCG